MRIELPDPSLVVLIGASGSGKSTFAAEHFRPTETISSDFCRSLVADDPNDQAATEDAFAVLHAIAGRRLARARLTAIDATNVQQSSRAGLLRLARERAARVERYTAAYGRYVWPVAGLEDLRLAPFAVLAAETGAFAGRDHGWHLERCDALVAADPDWIRRTDRRVVDVTAPDSEAAATAWWEELTGAGGEGMVVKPHANTVRGRRGLVQPGVKCRGREYLRIIYGPEYDAPDQLERLRSRSLGRKRSLAVREFALGVEALERFVRREPLYRVHECVFAVLALESEPVDPRL